MAKTRPAGPKKAKANRHRSKASTARPSAMAATQRPSKTPRVLVDEAMAAMTRGDVQAALEFAQQALQAVEQAGTRVHGGVGEAAVCALLGEIQLECGDADTARGLLERAVALDPQGTQPDAVGGGVDKFLYLAQLSEQGGRDSVAWFERGAAALRARMAARADARTDARAPAPAAEEEEDAEDVEDREKLGQVLCAVAEVWMTDLSFDEDCEAQCEKLTTEATLVAPGSPDVWQTLANVRISQNRPEEAKAALQRSLALWEEEEEDDDDDDDDDDNDNDDNNAAKDDGARTESKVPPFAVRVALVRLLLTVGWLDKAVSVAARLLREDEQSVEVWYLAGYAQYLAAEALREGAGGEQETVQWKACMREARRCLGRCLRRFRQQDYEDERLGEHAKELMAEAVAAVGPAPVKEEEEEDDDDDDDDEWEDAGVGEDEEMG